MNAAPNQTIILGVQFLLDHRLLILIDPKILMTPPHIGPKSLILAPQDIPDISGYQLGFACQCVKAYNNENPVTNQKIL